MSKYLPPFQMEAFSYLCRNSQMVHGRYHGLTLGGLVRRGLARPAIVSHGGRKIRGWVLTENGIRTGVEWGWLSSHLERRARIAVSLSPERLTS